MSPVKTFFRSLPACLTLAASLPALTAAEAVDERPDPIRFAKTSLSKGEFFEPIEMAILPNLDVLIVQRRGEILHYDQQDDQIYRVGFLDAYYSSDAPGVNAEEGVLGITADPDFEENSFIYIFYSPSDKVVNRLSRFVFKDRILDMESEKVILEFYSQRDICCHTGGSLAFGPDRLLYLSTGDNSTPFNERDVEHTTDGFAPLNDIEGKDQYDARRTAANTNDLRGKILRIRILPDGSYEIPEGNLFPATDKTRPEIFTMGHRNPYRISVDPLDGTVYWGDVGPDASSDQENRGPRGYDEMNRASEPGNYGWPLFIGDNYPYRDFDYETGESGDLFDPQNPVNDSVHNTGLEELPPAQTPFIWYPYAESEMFPEMGSGGRNAMAGPVYYEDLYPESTRLPAYYDGKVIMHDWIRNHFVVVDFDEQGKLASVEPFLEKLEFSGPIDVEMGPDGRLYVLEYGAGWFSRNPDSGLSRIDFIRGNLPPQIESVSVEKTSGRLPFRLSATADVSDPEGDAMQFEWQIGSRVVKTEGPELRTELTTLGMHPLTLRVTDSNGSVNESDPIEVYAGNDQPKVTVTVDGNQSLYFPNTPVSYQVSVEDDSEVVEENIFISASMESSSPIQQVGHQILTREEQGRIAMTESDCLACHKEQETSIGPSFEQIALRYRDMDGANSLLANKIIKGGAGNWGEVPMPGHASMSETEVSKIVDWILSKAKTDEELQSLPLKGSFDPATLDSNPWRQVFTIRASYTDQPAAGIQALPGQDAVGLRPSRLTRFAFEEMEGIEQAGRSARFADTLSSFKIEQVDLRNIAQVALSHSELSSLGVSIELRLASPEGSMISSAPVNEGEETVIDLGSSAFSDGPQDVYFVFRFEKEPADESLLHSVEFIQEAK
ncbi:PQQ-dependent sugar dehydrogenase [Pelagicoccus sp. SDUM812003]|uniref:PQQ-dependent sugar dehydrogenase n=1 Tax=Pelagicoccus sp. SDUM812003 TaxID=3041267 RepID=UPI00280CD045|nr:PQQ-dependent sugar dehydrogenase [Pelagicoccus sp. SDUM812003]MDQ8203506.1 PQQ-dependent sugar dehydrogenase [Pelagicoccus sp. SDUM812003]